MIESNVLVSIITVTRNRAFLIHRAIDSILSQSYPNLEYLIIDGASTDNTKEVVNSYDDNRIKYIELPENLSVPRSINIGLEKAKGEYITFLDDDDEFLPTKIEKQLKLIQTLPENYGFVYCWMSYIDDKTKKILYVKKTELRGNVASEVVEKPTVSGVPTYFFKRVALESIGGWKEDLGIESDWETSARACQYYLVDFVPESLVNVYVNHGSLRMSDPGYYNKNLQRLIKFHSYFLNEFKQVFDQYPKKMVPHLYEISRAYFMMGKWRKGLPFYKSLLNKSLTIKYLLLPVYCLLIFKKKCL